MKHAPKPRPEDVILVSDADHDKLTGLARAFLDRAPETAEDLLSEMDRATVTTAGKMPANVVRMGSAVTIRNGAGTQCVTLVYPAEADIAANKVSVMTPMGVALIGAAAGQSVKWERRDGREMVAEIVSVEPPAGGEP